MLEIKEIWKTFNAGTVNEKQALRGVSLTLKDGDFCTVIGGNGAGKSTLIRHLTGIFRQDAGTVRIGGEDVWENAALKARIAAIPDDWYYFLQSSIRDMMRFYLSLIHI